MDIPAEHRNEGARETLDPEQIENRTVDRTKRTTVKNTYG
jgi:hypothetical protein